MPNDKCHFLQNFNFNGGERSPNEDNKFRNRPNDRQGVLRQKNERFGENDRQASSHQKNGKLSVNDKGEKADCGSQESSVSPYPQWIVRIPDRLYVSPIPRSASPI